MKGVSLQASAWTTLALALVLAQSPARAQRSTDGTKAQSAIYSCIDDQGHKRTADRPIPECSGREQKRLNRDGSLQGVQPPVLTAEEQAEKEARERAAAEARAAAADAKIRDRNLALRYPDEAAHTRAREAALDTARQAAKASEARLRELAAERKPLLDEAEFYQGKALPPKLRAALDANDAAIEAQRSAVTSQEAELARINSLFDTQLTRLRALWLGAPPGSLGALPTQGGSAPVRGPIKPVMKSAGG